MPAVIPQGFAFNRTRRAYLATRLRGCRKPLVAPARSDGLQRGKFLCRRRLVDRSFSWSAYPGYAVSY